MIKAVANARTFAREIEVGAEIFNAWRIRQQRSFFKGRKRRAPDRETSGGSALVTQSAGAEYGNPCASATALQVSFPFITLMPPAKAGIR